MEKYCSGRESTKTRPRISITNNTQFCTISERVSYQYKQSIIFIQNALKMLSKHMSANCQVVIRANRGSHYEGRPQWCPVLSEAMEGRVMDSDSEYGRCLATKEERGGEV